MAFIFTYPLRSAFAAIIFADMGIPPDHKQLFEEARRYEELGDSYHAIKLYKRVIKLAPDWKDPYLALGRQYHQRHEWKPAYHYFKKTVALSPDEREAWWGLGMAATALKKWRVARSVWSKFGMGKIPQQPEGLRLTYNGQFEILWMRPESPAHGRILSIPHPASGFHFGDLVMYERKPIGHHIVQNRRIPVYAEFGHFKRSPYQTFSCLVHDVTEEQITQLEQMCHGARLGFEVWSNAARGMVIDHPEAFPEYYGRSIIPKEEEASEQDHALVAIAALHQAEVLHILDAWQVVSLGAYSDLRAY